MYDVIESLKIQFNQFILQVLDHCHFTGQYRGAAHSICNLKARVDIDDMKIPVWFHNFSGYDSHHILKCFAEEDTEL